jgi:HD-GYP domain-containing protein (c-di-GMP phosphodiesterase class II)
MKTFVVTLHELLSCLSKAQDLVSPVLSNHHERVAYLSIRLAEQLKLPIELQKDIFLAALVHDIGALSLDERLETIESEPQFIHTHARRGAKLFEGFSPLQRSTQIIKYHHMPWNDGNNQSHKGEAVPYASHVVHLADRVCGLIDSSQNILIQIPQILAEIKQNINTVYEPDLVEALFQMSKKEYVWLDLISSSPIYNIPEIGFYDSLALEIDDITDLTYVFSRIIDFRSRFTARHSAGVAGTAESLAKLIGFSPLECKMMKIAGYLHDLGKLAVKNSVLEKPSRLDEEEFNEIRCHTYYTYQLLDSIDQFSTIKLWASYHHEKLNGKGYPFQIEGDNLTMGSRIMAVADVFTAITENRPYRDGMESASAIEVMRNMVKNGSLDGKVVDLLIENFDEINSLRDRAQEEASARYASFLDTE